MQFALVLAIFLVYLVMAAQFESLIHPLVIMFSVPLALVGAVLALFITHTTISVVVFIGLIMLAGIVVNNAIVLIDLVNQLRARGMETGRGAGGSRPFHACPIVMTMLTTTLGRRAWRWAWARAPRSARLWPVHGHPAASCSRRSSDPGGGAGWPIRCWIARATGRWLRPMSAAAHEGQHAVNITEFALKRPVTIAGDLRQLPRRHRRDRARASCRWSISLDIEFPAITVQVPYQGSSPEEVERLITASPSRSRWARSPGVKRMDSTSDADWGRR